MSPIRAKDLFAELHKSDDYRKAHEKLASKLILARNVLRRRVELNLSQTQLASAAGMRQPRVADLEGGKGNPRLETLERLAKALHTTPDRLIRADAGADGYDEETRVPVKEIIPWAGSSNFGKLDIRIYEHLTLTQSTSPKLTIKQRANRLF